MNIIDKNLSFGNMDMSNNPKMIIVHHLEAEGVNWTVEQIHNMHVRERRFSGIGYHDYIRLDGSVFKGRPDNAVGAHCLGANQDSIGVAFEGDYEVRTQMPEAQMKAWVELKAYYNSKYGNLPVFGHTEKGQSKCPGKYFPLAQVKNATIGKTSNKKYVVTNYLPAAYKGYEGVDISAVLEYFQGVKCYIRGNAKGVWIETQYLETSKCEELKKTLGSWFYSMND